MSSWGKADTTKPATEEEQKEPMKFTKLSPEMTTKKLKIGVHGMQKTGKTRFCMSAPGPVYMIITEPGVKPLARLFPDKEIYFVEVYEPDYTGTFEVEPTQTLKNIDEAVKLIRTKALENPENVKTVVVDSVSDIWKWVQEWMKAEVLKIDKTARVKQQWDWGHANNKYQNIIMQLISLPCHVILTGQDREEYVAAGSPSGETVPRWQKQTPYWVDIVIKVYKQTKKVGGLSYFGTIEDCRHMGPELQPIAGETMENIDYDKLGEKLI